MQGQGSYQSSMVEHSAYGKPQFQPPPSSTAPQEQTPFQQPQAPSKSGFDRLKDVSGVFIKQKADAEQKAMCESDNIYYIYPMNMMTESKKGRKLFKATETSHCIDKRCATGHCRPFHLAISLADDDESIDDTPFLALDRPCTCTLYCFNRPEVFVYKMVKNKGGWEKQLLGKIRNPWDICNVAFDVHDSQGYIKYNIIGESCQCGLVCNGCPCSVCEHVEFVIKHPSGSDIGKINKKPPGCCKALISSADNFSITFPPNSTKEERALFLAATLLLDYIHFE